MPPTTNGANAGGRTYFTQRTLFGISTSLILVAVAVMSLVVSIQDRHDHPDQASSCGASGKPPLREWLFGTGISFLVIAFSYVITSASPDHPSIFSCISALSSAFFFVWAVVGAVTLGQHSIECKTANPTMWGVGVTAVVMNWLVWAFGTYTFYSSLEG
jgi:hypothetical protein